MGLAGCSGDNKHQDISQEDLDFIESLRKSSNKEYISSIDSVLENATKNTGRIALLYQKKGELQSRSYAYIEAIKNFNTALHLFEEIEATEYIPDIYWNLGSSNAFLSKKVIANQQLLKALQLSKETGDQKTEANSYASLAHVHYLYSDFSTSIDYTKKAIDIHESIKDTLGLSSTYNNLAIIYKNIGCIEEALEYNIKSLDLNYLKNDTAAIAMSYNNIGNIHSKILNDTEESVPLFLKAIQLNKVKGLLNSSPLENMGDLYSKLKETKQSKYYYSQALIIENQKTSVFTKYKLHNALLEIHLQENDFKNAIFHQQKRDSLNNVQTRKETKEKLDLVEKQHQLFSSQQKLDQEKKLNKKNKIIFIIISGILLLLLLSWILYEKYKKMKFEKEKISLEQKVLRSQMNPHFIFNVLSSIQNSLMDNDPIKSATYLSKFAKLFRQNFDFINRKTITLRDEIDVLENYVSAQKLRYKDKFEYEMQVSHDIDIDQTEIPPFLLQPFLENAIEHGFKNKKEAGKVTITISKTNNSIQYEIIDNGKGFDTSKKSTNTHALDVFKKRIKLLGNGDEKSLLITSTNEGTSIKFKLKDD